MAIKRIRAPHSEKDRIVCVATSGKLDFYYQPEHTNDRFWLLQQPFSGSIWHYFQNKGCNMFGHGFSLTISELYMFRNFKNPKLSRLFSRLPSSIDYVIKNEGEDYLETPVRKNLFNMSFEKFLKQKTNYMENYDCVA